MSKKHNHLSRLAKGSILLGAFAAQGLLASAVSAQTNIAQGKPITASSYVDVYTAQNGNDGNQGSYWESANHAFPQTMTVDLGASKTINKVTLKLPANWGDRSQTLSIQGSNDGTNFSTIASSAARSFSQSNGNVVNITFADTNARFVRVNFTGNSSWPAGQISEFEVYGTDVVVPPPTRDAFSRIDAASFDGMNGIQTEGTTDTGGGSNVGWIEGGDWLRFNSVDFGSGAGSVNARVASNNDGGTIEFRLGSPTGTLIGSVNPMHTGGWQNWETINGAVNASGVHDVYLVFVGNGAGLFNVNWVEFDQGDVVSVPSTPQNLASASVTTSSVSLSWNSAAGANGYDVLRNGSVIDSTTSTSYQDTGLSESTTYTYSVQAYNDAGNSAASNSISVTTEGTSTPLPATPQNLSATGTTTSTVSLSWNAAANAAGYDILRNGSVISSTTSTSFQDTGLASDTTYSYTVRAYNQTGQSSQSNSVSATTEGTIVNPPTGDNVAAGKAVTATSTLSFLSTSNAVDGDQGTYWESNSGAFPQALTVDLGSTHFVSQVVLKLPNDAAWETRTQTLSVQGSSDGSSFNTLVGSTGYVFNPASANTVTINFSEAEARYVRINVTNNTGWTAAQISEFEVIGYPDPVPPSTPQNLSVGGGSSSTVYLTWEASGLADGYEVLRDGSVVAEVTNTSYQDTGLMESTSYNYSVRAYNEFGSSAASATVTGTTLDGSTDPGPSDKRGATMPYTLQQAENAVVGGGANIVGPNRIIGDLAGEASGRMAVTLNNTGAYVEFNAEQATNTLVTRFSIPDAPGGGGINATLNIYVDGQFEKAIELTSKHAWMYGDETHPNNNPSSGGPRHIYDEAGVMFDRVIPAGSTIRLQKDAGNTTDYAIDFISLELVSPLPNPNPSTYVTPNGFTHQAVQNALDQARMNDMEGVYLPAGTYQTAYKFQMNGKPLKVMGAGAWYTRFETPSDQTNTDAGFHVTAPASGSTFSHFSFFGNYVSRIDGPGKVFDFNGVSDMTIDNVWVEHQVCMFWGTSTHNNVIKNSRMRNLFADGINFTNGSSGNHVVNNEARSTGDDSFALFAATDNGGGIVENNLYENLTAMTPWRAAGLASYGGQGNTFRNIHVEDTLTYSGVTISSLNFGYAFTGFQHSPTTNFEGITILRSGGHFWGSQVFPGLWMFSASSTFRGIRITDMDIIDPTYHGIMFQTNYSGGQAQNPFENTVLKNVTISGAHKTGDQYDSRSGFGIWANPMAEQGQGPAIGTVTFENLKLINNAINIKNDSPDFEIILN